MIEGICGDCGQVFIALPVLGRTACTHCGSDNTYVAVTNPESEVEEGKPLE